jgi:hypothetical protein
LKTRTLSARVAKDFTQPIEVLRVGHKPN